MNWKIKGYRIADQLPVVIKQVPRSKINKMMKLKERSIPAEFYYHLQASECSGVVKVSLMIFFIRTFSLTFFSGAELVRTTDKFCADHGETTELN